MFNETNLWNYQQVGVKHVLDNPFSGLFLDMGLGKTVTTLTAINRAMYHDFEIESVLIVGPKRVVESVWMRESLKWSHLKHLTFNLIKGSAKKRLAALRNTADIHLIGVDNFAWLVAQFGGKIPQEWLVIDESSKFKNHDSVRFKAAKAVRPSLKRVTLLTGTPAPNGLLDLWAQLFLIDRGERLGRTITSYRDTYFKAGKRKGGIVYDYKIADDLDTVIHDKIKDVCISMKAEDLLDLPPCRFVDIVIDFDDKLAKRYRDFEKEAVLELIEKDTKDGFLTITAASAAALSNKLLQFTSGAVYDEDKNYHVIHDLKIEALRELLEANENKNLLVARNFTHEETRIFEALKDFKPRSIKEGVHVEDEWNAGKIRTLVMHPASGGHGLNLQDGGHIAVWFGLNWSLELYQQFNKRLDRQGQKHPVTIYRIVIANTYDDMVIKALERKDVTQEGLMQAVKALVKKYR